MRAGSQSREYLNTVTKTAEGVIFVEQTTDQG